MAETRGRERLRGRAVSVQRGRRTVLRGVDVSASEGEVLAILGPNGAGKSTLLRALSGLSTYAGEIALDGVPVRALTATERATRLTFLPQRSQLTAHLAAADVVAQGRFAHRGGFGRLTPGDRDRIAAALQAARVAHLATRAFDELSYGEQRRVLLARALATGARVLLLDEPTASLDIAQALELQTQLRALAAGGHCVVVVLHDLNDALRWADSGLLLQDGQAVASGPIAQVLTAERVEAVFGVVPIPGAATRYRLRGESA